jgi:signal transduction histidine kinase
MVSAIDSSKAAPTRTKPLALKLGLRPALLLALLPVLLLPWVGLRFVGQMADITREERREALVGAARGYAAALHERADLFVPRNETALPGGASALTATSAKKITVDGKVGDWPDAKPVKPTVLAQGEAPADTLQVEAFAVRLESSAGSRQFVMLNAVDERYVPRRKIKGSEDFLPGDTVLFWAGAQPDEMLSIPVQIVGTPKGWLSELELPTGTRFVRFKIQDVDYQARRDIEATADSGLLVLVGGADEVDSLKALQAKRRAQLWDSAIVGIDRSGLRVAVYDASGNLLALRGDFSGLAPAPTGFFAKMGRALLSFAVGIGAKVDDSTPNQPPLSQALNGFSGDSSRRVVDQSNSPFWVTTSAQPIWFKDKVAGALLLEQGSTSDLATAQSALEWLALLAAAAILATVLALLGLGSLTVARVRRLRHAANSAIDARGRVVGEMPRYKLTDEISELAADYDDVLMRLREHQRYLSNLRSRLVHELRTPIMVVRSSLENIADTDDSQIAKSQDYQYVERALGGATRLEKIVANMSEAASLETMLNESQLEPTNLTDLLAGLTQAYNAAYADKSNQARFELDVQIDEDEDPVVMVVPEAIAQAVDKLASNAADFAQPGSDISVELSEEDDDLVISVINVGRSLPEEMSDQLFESMVSIRNASASEQSHLGLGLYLVRLIAQFHGGVPFAHNVRDGVRIGFTISQSTQDHFTQKQEAS